MDGDTDAKHYSRLEADRDDFLTRARENALVTIPALMPPEGHNRSTALYQPWQSTGSHGVNTLAAKLQMTLLPPNAPVFRLSVTDLVIAELDQVGSRSGVEKKLNEIERSVMDEIEGIGIRAALNEALKQLIVCGNVLLYLPKKGNLKVYRLDRYVVQRDFEGNVLRVIIKETVAIETLPEDVQEMLREAPSDLPSDDTDSRSSEKEVDVYTVFTRKDDRIVSHQSIKGRRLPRSEGSWKIDRAPIMALRWNFLHDENYGRAYVDEYIGDLTGIEAYSKALREGAAAASKINPMVNPSGQTRARDIARAKNLEVISGRAEDVTMLQFEKQADMRFVLETMTELVSRLQHAFMMNRSVQRQAERVTAEEIRSLVSDIDDILGGIYSLLAVELQRPLVIRIMDRMVSEKKIPDIEKIKGEDGRPVTSIKIVTGIEALGRGHDYNKYLTLARDILAPLGEQAWTEVNMSDFIRRAAVSLSIDTDGLLKSADEKAQDVQVQQGRQQQALLSQMMSDATKGAAGPVAKVAAENFRA